jgi:hypothetical protein
MWVSLEQMATSHHHLLKTIPLSLLTALLPKVKPMASRMKGSSMNRLPSQQGGAAGTHPQQPIGNQGQPYNGYQKPNGYYQPERQQIAV